MHAAQVWYSRVLIWTHRLKHPRQNSDTVPLCAHVFGLVVRTGALPTTLPTRRNGSSVYTVDDSYDTAEKWYRIYYYYKVQI